MAETTIGETITDLHPHMVRVLAKRLMRPPPPSFKMANWPNDLGDTPIDAIGKSVRIEMHDVARDFVVFAVRDDGELLLSYANG